MFGSGALSRFEKANWQMGAVFTDSNSAAPAGQQTFAGTNVQGNSITINLLGHFFSMVTQKKLEIDGQWMLVSEDWRVDDRLGTKENQALVLLHELGHLMGVLGDDRSNPGLGEQFNKDLARNCFGKK